MNSVPLFFFSFREIPYPRKVSFSRDNIYSTRPNIFSIIIYTRLLIFNVFFFYSISVFTMMIRENVLKEKILKSEFNYFIFKGLIILLKSVFGLNWFKLTRLSSCPLFDILVAISFKQIIVKRDSNIIYFRRSKFSSHNFKWIDLRVIFY